MFLFNKKRLKNLKNPTKKAISLFLQLKLKLQNIVSYFCYLGRLFFDQSPSVYPVSESSWESLSVTQDKGRKLSCLM